MCTIQLTVNETARKRGNETFPIKVQNTNAFISISIGPLYISEYVTQILCFDFVLRGWTKY